MALSPYIKPPEPADHVVIFTTEGGETYTWGEHRQMEAMLAELEEQDELVAMARQKLDYKLREADIETLEPELICRHCHQPMSKPHDFDCPESNDPAHWVKREAGGYEYLDDKLQPVHLTSVPMTDEEALEYFGIVQLMFPTGEVNVTYITRREINGHEFKMMPWKFDKETWEVTPIGKPADG